MIYQESGEVVEIIGMMNPVVSLNSVSWEGGALGGINLPFLILDDDVTIGEGITDGLIQLDKKSEFKKLPLEEENELLKAQIQENKEKTDFHAELIAEMAMMVYL